MRIETIKEKVADMKLSQKIATLEKKLDGYVVKAERCGKHTNARAENMAKADEVREMLREIE